MSLTFYGYPKCGTCRKAQKWLEAHDIPIKYINIAEQPPTKEQVTDLQQKSGLPLRKFFNTSGKKYRELGLKDKVKTASEDKMLDWLASDGMLLKRPIVTDGKRVTVGFAEDRFTEVWGS
jgi:arsenate reductase